MSHIGKFMHNLVGLHYSTKITKLMFCHKRGAQKGCPRASICDIAKGNGTTMFRLQCVITEAYYFTLLARLLPKLA